MFLFLSVCMCFPLSLSISLSLPLSLPTSSYSQHLSLLSWGSEFNQNHSLLCVNQSDIFHDVTFDYQEFGEKRQKMEEKEIEHEKFLIERGSNIILRWQRWSWIRKVSYINKAHSECRSLMTGSTGFTSKKALKYSLKCKDNFCITIDKDIYLVTKPSLNKNSIKNSNQCFKVKHSSSSLIRVRVNENVVKVSGSV